jgi:hypothetical protein
MLRSISINEARRLAHINFFLQVTMEQSVLNIQLMQRPTSRNCQRKEEPNSGMLDNGSKGILIVKTIALLEPFGNKTRLIALNGPTYMFLHFEHPL